MSEQTGIEWTDATWNPTRGCSRVSEGCRNCYAEKVAYRFSGPGMAYEGLVQVGVNGQRRPQWNGVVQFVEEHLLDPMRWKEPRRIFVNSMSDLFHEGLTDEHLDQVFAVMALCPQHTFQVLTKRPERMRVYLDGCVGRLADRIEAMRTDQPRRAVGPLPHLDGGERWFPLANVWLGVSIENQQTADHRVPLLLGAPAAVRFVSYEPALGWVRLDDLPARLLDEVAKLDDETGEDWRYTALSPGDVYWTPDSLSSDGPEHPALDWVICGGESGSGARPMHPDWARSIRDQCASAGVPFFFKQWGEFSSAGIRVGKKAAGNRLDGVQWKQFPATAVGA